MEPMNRPAGMLRPRSQTIAIVLATTLLGASAASAGAASEIEGIWSFNGGQIGIQHLPNGTYSGTVVVATRFAECTHPVGQEIWKGMTVQPNGSYWGLHQWYLGAPACALNPTLGPTAWRILEENGSRYLRVCFSHPGTSQPTIAANGAPRDPSEYFAYHVTYGCTNSALTAPLPVAQGKGGAGGGGSRRAGSTESLRLPSARQCLSVRFFRIHLRNPKYDPFKAVTITLKVKGHRTGRRIATSHRGSYVVATIDLKGLPKGTFTLKIRATTVLGHKLSAKRTYHTCIPKARSRRRHRKG
jgi:hypothetical protein